MHGDTLLRAQQARGNSWRQSPHWYSGACFLFIWTCGALVLVSSFCPEQTKLLLASEGTSTRSLGMEQCNAVLCAGLHVGVLLA